MKTLKSLEEKPLHLVSINSFDKLVLHYQAANYLKTLKSPLSILSIAGPYRTGKSFLLNSLIGSTQTITNQNNKDNTPLFEVGHTTNQTTHGLWIWSKPLLSYDENNQITNVIVMDSEGYASVQSTHDKRLITLALLLSTCFLYNSKGVIDKDSLFDLQFVIEVARLISQKQDNKHPQDAIKRKCDFHWILRDFQLELTNQLGHKITANEYMENCLLQAQEKVSQPTVQTLRQYFPQRSCHTLCHPSTNQQDKQQRPQFISAILSLKQQIFRKKMKSLQMSGEKFVQLLQSYINAMNQGVNMESVFQQGYDCRVRMDCLDKLLSKLKKLQRESQHQQQIDSQILSIKEEIKQFYHERMCSHRLIEALDSEVEGILSEYQQQVRNNIQNRSFLASSMRSMGDNNRGDRIKETSVRCLDRSMDRSRDRSRDRDADSLNVTGNSNQKNNNNNFTNNNPNNPNTSRHMLSIPRTSNRVARNSALCSQFQRSFIIDQESIDMGRTSRAVERRSAQKQKISAQVKTLNKKVEQFEVKLHRTQLQLSTAQCEVTHLKEQLQAVRHLLSQRQDELLNTTQSSNQEKKQLITKIQILEQQLSLKQNQTKLLQSEIDKLTLLYTEKIRFLQKQLAESDIIKQTDFTLEKNKYKQKIDQLTEEIKDMKINHELEIQSVREIFKEKEMKLKSFFNHGLELDSLKAGKGVYEELQQILKLNQTLKQQLQHQKLTVSKLHSQLQSTQFKLNQKQQTSKQQHQQLQKRHLQNQFHLKSIYQSKLESKDKQISELQAKIKALSENALNQNKRLIESLKEMESHYSLQKEDLFVINTQLRKGCLEALEKVNGLKEEVEMKDGWIKQLQNQKSQLSTKILQLKQVIQQYDIKIRQLQKQLRQSSLNHKQEIDELQNNHTNQQQSLSKQLHQLQQPFNQQQIQLERIKYENQQLSNRLGQTQQRLKSAEKSYQELSQDWELKALDYEATIEEKQNQIQQLRKELEIVNQSRTQTIREKEQLKETIETINRQAQDKYEGLEAIEYQKQQRLVKRYQQQLGQLKQKQKALFTTIQQKDSELSTLQQTLQSLQNQLSYKNHSLTSTQQQLTQIKAQLQIKELQSLQAQRQSSKQLAILTKQIKQQEQKVKTGNNDGNGRLQELESKYKQLKDKNMSLAKEIDEQKMLLQQERTQNQQYFSHLTKQNQSLQSKLTQHYCDNSALKENLLQLQELIRTQQIQQENHIRLYNEKLNKLKQQKISLEKYLEKEKDKNQHLLTELKLTKSNYQSDFSLWTKKMAQMELILRQGGFIGLKSK